jgi:hypothetical protein
MKGNARKESTKLEQEKASSECIAKTKGPHVNTREHAAVRVQLLILIVNTPVTSPPSPPTSTTHTTNINHPYKRAERWERDVARHVHVGGEGNSAVTAEASPRLESAPRMTPQGNTT